MLLMFFAVALAAWLTAFTLEREHLAGEGQRLAQSRRYPSQEACERMTGKVCNLDFQAMGWYSLR